MRAILLIALLLAGCSSLRVASVEPPRQMDWDGMLCDAGEPSARCLP